MKIQLALDLLDINKIHEIINETIEYIDVIELGTPLIMKYGINIVNDIKNIHRNKYILADLKIADGGKKEAEIGFKAGADIITVLSHSDKNTLLYVKEASKNFNKKVMLDFLNNDFNKNNYLNLLKYEFDFYCIHTSHDSTYDGHNPLNDLKRFNKICNKNKIAVAGGINLKLIDKIIVYEPSLIIIGSHITNNDNPKIVAENIFNKINNVSK
jgi:3-hexulose-6-phosphate synthase